MQQFQEKFELWTKYMQSGKTQAMIDDIVSRLDDDSVRDIIFCSNNLMLTQQTKSRISKLAKIHSAMTHFIFSSTSKTHHTTVEKAQHAIRNHRIMLACSNKTRLTDIPIIIKSECQNKKVTIFIDEVHATPLKHIIEMAQLRSVQRIVGITATPDNIFAHKKMKNCKINVRAMDACNISTYYGWDDCTHVIKDYDDGLPDFLSKYKTQSKIEVGIYLYKLLKDKTLVFNNSDVIFVPGTRYQVSHECIRDILLHFGFYVFVFNSNEKNSKGFYLSKTEIIQIPQMTEDDNGIGSVMGKLRQKYPNKPIGITGHLSIGMGNTLADWDSDFYITKAVLGFPFVVSESGKYHEFLIQLVGRSFGDNKEKNPTLKVQLFMKQLFYNQAKEYIKSGALSEYVKNKDVEELCMSFEDLKLARREMLQQDEKALNDFIDEDDYDDDAKYDELVSFSFKSYKSWRGLKDMFDTNHSYSKTEADVHFGLKGEDSRNDKVNNNIILIKKGEYINDRLLKLNKDGIFIGVPVEVKSQDKIHGIRYWNDIDKFAQESGNNPKYEQLRNNTKPNKFICIPSGTELPILFYCFYDK
eukprot:76621_1